MDDDDKMGDQLAQFETLRDAMLDKGMELKLRVVFMKRLFFSNITTPIEHYDKTTLDLLFVQVSFSLSFSSHLLLLLLLFNPSLISIRFNLPLRLRKISAQVVCPRPERLYSNWQDWNANQTQAIGTESRCYQISCMFLFMSYRSAYWLIPYHNHLHCTQDPLHPRVPPIQVPGRRLAKVCGSRIQDTKRKNYRRGPHRLHASRDAVATLWLVRSVPPATTGRL
mgnify:FL=1